MTALDLRVVRDDGVVLVQHRINDDDDDALIEIAATIGGERTGDALADGHTCVLQYRDPDGVLAPAAEWITIVGVGTVVA